MWSRCIAMAVWLQLILGAAFAGHAQTPLTITTVSTPQTTAGTKFRTRIGATGGMQPYTWQVTAGKLPPGLKLDAKLGVIFGTPTMPGEYNFALAVADSNIPANRAERAYRLIVTAALGIVWKKAPQVHDQKLEGSVMVTNYTQQDFTLTVVVVAVNEIGRATALGYQEFQLKRGTQQVIPFGSEPGPGKYIVHADAVADVVTTNTIYRARQQTPGTLEIQSPE